MFSFKKYKMNFDIIIVPLAYIIYGSIIGWSIHKMIPYIIFYFSVVIYTAFFVIIPFVRDNYIITKKTFVGDK